MSTPTLTDIPAEAEARAATTGSLLRLATAGSVDDGKSTLVGRLLFDSKSVLRDQLAAVEQVSLDRGLTSADLALLTDGLRAEREQGITIDWIRQQIKIAFLNVTADQAKTAVIAYEPIWAIGTGKVATTEQAEEVCAAIRVCIGEIYDEATAEAIRIQYGGSVSASSAPELFAQANIDGGLVGGASLKPDFGKIVNYNK